jgi:hemerythrin-like domain-containing protein
MNNPIDSVLAIHNAFRRDIALIDAVALAAARGECDFDATVERVRFLNEVLEWHAHGEDAVIFPLLESVAPSVYETYEQDHRALDAAFDFLMQAVAASDSLETARATKAFKFHLDLHLDKEDAHMYRIIRERVAIPDQGHAMALMGSHAPHDRFPEIVAWLFPLIGDGDRVNMIRSWQMGMPPAGFAGAAKLIEQATGDDWPELTRRIPELVGGR